MIMSDWIKLLLPMCLTAIIGLTAYFYKQWANKMDAYRSLLVELMDEINTNAAILDFGNLEESCRAGIQILKPFPYFELGEFAEAIRACIQDTNYSLVCLKVCDSKNKKDVEYSLFQLNGLSKMLQLVLNFCNRTLARHMIVYYVFKWKFQEEADALYMENYPNKNQRSD